MSLQIFHWNFSLPSMRPALFVFALCYLAFHMLNGERGAFALIRSSHALQEVERQIEVTMQSREVLEKRVMGLRASSLDMDLLDEQSRNMLGVAREAEFVVILPNVNR